MARGGSGGLCGGAFRSRVHPDLSRLLYTTATRAVLFIYLAPFFVVLGARIVLPADRFGAAQWLGLGCRSRAC
jgi:drug/metabolite transporter (DMT)-like permease